MPTPKQVRYHFRRVEKAYDRLSDAMIEAHNANVIRYPKEQYREEGPCYALSEVWGRIMKTTEAQLAQAMREEIRAADKKKYSNDRSP